MSERNTFRKHNKLIPYLVAAALIEAGKLVAVNAAGYLVEASDAAGLIVVGVADETVDNSAGNAGDLSCTVRRNEAYLFANSAANPVVQASVGSNVFVEDAETVAVAAGPVNDIVAGVCLGVGADGVWIAIG